MKKNYFLLLLVAATAAMATLTACQDLDMNPSPNSDYAVVTPNASFNAADIIKTYTFKTRAGERVSIPVTAPFATRMDPEFDANGKKLADSLARWIVYNYGKCTSGAISLTTTENLTNHYGLNITTDLEFYVYETGKSHVEGVFNTFAYPVRIRQVGTDGTYYLTAEQIRKWKTEPNGVFADMPDKGDEFILEIGGRNYVKGTVKSLGSLQQETKTPQTANGSWSAPWAIVGSHFVNRDFDIMEMTVDVDGEELPVRLEYMSDYKLFSNFNVKTGDTVEICFRKAGATRTHGLYYASPLDVFKI